MKWKDTGDDKVANPENADPYYEDDGYPSFKEQEMKKNPSVSGLPKRFVVWGLGLAAVVCGLFLILSFLGEPVDETRIADLEQRLALLEEKLDKVDGVDEKVTRIWEQAKSFETFKSRFDRSEASMSLRMDHLAMSLDALQKKTNETAQKLSAVEKKAPVPAAAARPSAVKTATAAPSTHTVTAGETLYSISKRYNLTVEALRSLNKLPKGAVIHVGQKLVVASPGN